jgi:hypothetical protein
MIRRFALLFRLNELRNTDFSLESIAEIPIINVFYVNVLGVPGTGNSGVREAGRDKRRTIFMLVGLIGYYW